jgi:putative transposase
VPRQPRIDQPGLLNHVIFRGIERRAIFLDRLDYEQFLSRLETVKEDAQILAWALMPNHGHLLLRTGLKGLSSFMRRLLTSYALYFNRRYRRVGHLFQNRYKSIVCDEDVYLKTLVRYIHLNPLKAGLVKNLEELEAYPWSGHATLLGKAKNGWQAAEEVLSQYGERRAEALRQYRKHMEEGIGLKEDLSGGGLIRSAGGLKGVLARRRPRDYETADERVLGDGAFVQQILSQVEQDDNQARRAKARHTWQTLQERVCQHFNVEQEALRKTIRGRTVVKARELFIYLGMTYLGMSGEEIGERLNKTRSAVSQAYYRASRWIQGDDRWKELLS